MLHIVARDGRLQRLGVKQAGITAYLTHRHSADCYRGTDSQLDANAMCDMHEQRKAALSTFKGPKRGYTEYTNPNSSPTAMHIATTIADLSVCQAAAARIHGCPRL